jgi:diketogulonate reductase-like aldo/keto reductase
VAIAYHLHKLPYVFPIIGGRKVEQLKENIAALDISLTPEQVQRIEAAAPFDPGFPNSMIVCFLPPAVRVFLECWYLTTANR